VTMFCAGSLALAERVAHYSRKGRPPHVAADTPRYALKRLYGVQGFWGTLDSVKTTSIEPRHGKPRRRTSKERNNQKEFLAHFISRAPVCVHVRKQMDKVTRRASITEAPLNELPACARVAQPTPALEGRYGVPRTTCA